jgi:hypothetical protein
VGGGGDRSSAAAPSGHRDAVPAAELLLGRRFGACSVPGATFLSRGKEAFSPGCCVFLFFDSRTPHHAAPRTHHQQQRSLKAAQSRGQLNCTFALLRRKTLGHISSWNFGLLN